MLPPPPPENSHFQIKDLAPSSEGGVEGSYRLAETFTTLGSQHCSMESSSCQLPTTALGQGSDRGALSCSKL